MRYSLTLTAIFLFVASTVVALHPGTEIVVPAAGRGGGAGGSLWVTSLNILNPGESDADVTFAWLVRNQANPTPQETTRTVAAGSTLVIEDAILDLFDLGASGGAILVTSASPVVVSAGIFNRAGGQEFGQGFEGLPTTVAIEAAQVTHSIGIANNDAYRTNFFAVDGSGVGAELMVEVVDGSDTVVGSRSYSLGAYQPILKNVSDLVSTPVDSGLIRFTVVSGKVFVGGSRVNEASGDPLTLNAWWECDGEDGDGSPGFAPESLVGLDFDLEVTPFECGQDPFTEQVRVVVTSETEAVMQIYGLDTPLQLDSYTYGGDIGFLACQIPNWHITNVWFNFVWTSATSGTFTGSATDLDGSPIQYSGAFVLVAR